MTMTMAAPSRICPRSAAHPCSCPEKAAEKAPHEQEDSRDSEQEWDPKDRRIYVFGALRAALLIALVYAVGFALIIGLLLLIWKH